MPARDHAAEFLPTPRHDPPGSDILVPAVLLDLYPKSAARLQ